MQNFNKTHLLSFTLQSGVAMTDHSTRKLDKCNPISQTFRKHISRQDLLQSNTNFYSQFLEVLIAQTTFLLGGLRNQDFTVHNIVSSGYLSSTNKTEENVDASNIVRCIYCTLTTCISLQ